MRYAHAARTAYALRARCANSYQHTNLPYGNAKGEQPVNLDQ